MRKLEEFFSLSNIMNLLGTLPQTGCEYKAVSYPQNTVSNQAMMQYMFVALDNYNKAMSEGQDPIVNPLNGRVIMHTSDGRTVEIPENIQRMAVMRYLENKERPQFVEIDQEEQQEQVVTRPVTTEPVVQPEKESKTKKYLMIFGILLLIFILYKGYQYYKMNYGNTNDF